MKRVVNWLLGISFLMLVLLGVLFYRSFLKYKTVDTTLLEQNAASYQGTISEKDGRFDEVAINYIFYISKEELKEVVVEVLDCNHGKLSYLTIPLDTNMVVSEGLYRKMSILNPSMPQLFQLNQMEEIFDQKIRYGYMQRILDEMLTIDSSFYTVIHGEESDFFTYRESIENSTSTIDTKQVETWMKESRDEITSNLSNKKRREYAKYYADIPKEDVVYEKIAGEKHTDSYELNLVSFIARLKQLESDE